MTEAELARLVYLEQRVAWLEKSMLTLLDQHQRSARSSARRYKNRAESEERFATVCQEMFLALPEGVKPNVHPAQP